MDSVQTMRWILVNMTAVAAIIAGYLGFYVAAAILLFGVAAHWAHWFSHRKTGAPAGGRGPGLRD